MNNVIDTHGFYFVSGQDKVYTGNELTNLIELGCISKDAYCAITGALDLLFWFKRKSFTNDVRTQYVKKQILYQVPVSSVDVMREFNSKQIKVNVIRIEDQK